MRGKFAGGVIRKISDLPSDPEIFCSYWLEPSQTEAHWSPKWTELLSHLSLPFSQADIVLYAPPNPGFQCSLPSPLWTQKTIPLALMTLKLFTSEPTWGAVSEMRPPSAVLISLRTLDTSGVLEAGEVFVLTLESRALCGWWMGAQGFANSVWEF